MATLQSVQGHTSLTHHFNFFDIWTLWRSGLNALVDSFLATIRESVGLKGLNTRPRMQLSGCVLHLLTVSFRPAGSQAAVWWRKYWQTAGTNGKTPLPSPGRNINFPTWTGRRRRRLVDLSATREERRSDDVT